MNTAVFETFCKANRPPDGSTFKGAIIVFMDEIEMKGASKTFMPVQSNAVLEYFLMHCGESGCKLPEHGHQVDPALKLYPGCPLMLTKRQNVANGQANGSRVFLLHVNLKSHEELFDLQLECGTKIHACFASQVKSLMLLQENEDISP